MHYKKKTQTDYQAPASVQDDRSNSLAKLFGNYRALCGYCDRFFEAAMKECRSQIRCARGCGACCVLGTVTPLEARMIEDFLHDHPGAVAAARDPSPATGPCPLVVENECSVYPARPIICRTHGLPVRHRGVGVAASCTMNFEGRDPDTLDAHVVLDMDKITENLLRLNLAYCRLTGRDKRAGERVALASLIGSRS